MSGSTNAGGGSQSFLPEEYTVGWICALPKELIAARAMLDVVHAKLKSQPKQDKNNYTLGSIGNHKVVIACLPEYGVVSAAVAASSMQNTFTRVRFGLMVGIGGGIPSETNDIRLGDIIVSRPIEQGSGVIQYDLGRDEIDGFKRIGTLDKPPMLLRTAITDLIATRGIGKEISELVNAAFGDDEDDESDDTWTHPTVADNSGAGSQDILFKPESEHITNKEGCEDCSKDTANIISRRSRRTPHPRVFYGNIASGNAVMKNGVKRDALAKRENVICFEMEAAGLMDSFPCLVIRGICDYADSHKNMAWQSYAAAVAAAYAKRLLFAISAEAVDCLAPIKTSK